MIGLCTTILAGYTTPDLICGKLLVRCHACNMWPCLHYVAMPPLLSTKIWMMQERQNTHVEILLTAGIHILRLHLMYVLLTF